MKKDNLSSLWQIVENKRTYGLPFDQLALLVLYALPLKWLELSTRGREAFEGRYSLGDLSFTFGKRHPVEELGAYMARIEDLLPGERDRAYTEEFIKNLETLMQKTKGEDAIRDIFLQIENVVSDQIEILDEIARTVLDKLFSGMGKNYLELTYNTSVIRLHSLLADCDSGMSIYDGFCGTGLLAIETAHNKSRIMLQDINRQAMSIATVICLLSENENCILNRGDSLLNPAEENGIFDRVVSEIPVSPRYDADYIRKVEQRLKSETPAINGDTASIAHILGKLKEDGRAVIRVPLGFLYKSGKTGAFREWMVNRNYIKQVIELPGGTFHNTAIPFALLVISKEKGNGDIFLLNAAKEGEFFSSKDRRHLRLPEDKVKEIVKICNAYEERKGTSRIVSHSEIAANEYNLTSLQYVSAGSEIPGPFTEYSRLTKRAEVTQGELNKIEKQLNHLRGAYMSD